MIREADLDGDGQIVRSATCVLHNTNAVRLHAASSIDQINYGAA
jgi:hypothetical protein